MNSAFSLLSIGFISGVLIILLGELRGIHEVSQWGQSLLFLMAIFTPLAIVLTHFSDKRKYDAQVSGDEQ